MRYTFTKITCTNTYIITSLHLLVYTPTKINIDKVLLPSNLVFYCYNSIITTSIHRRVMITFWSTSHHFWFLWRTISLSTSWLGPLSCKLPGQLKSARNFTVVIVPLENWADNSKVKIEIHQYGQHGANRGPTQQYFTTLR